MGILEPSRDLLSIRPPVVTQADVEADLEALLKTSSDAMWVMDGEGRLRRFNDAFALFCSSAIAITPANGMSLDALLPPQRRLDIHTFWSDLVRRTLGGQSLVAESHYTIAHVKRHFSITTTPVVQNGVTTGAAFLMRDITDYRRRKQHEFVELALARIFSESAPPRETFSRVLESLCVSIGWNLGIAWLVDATGEHLEPSAWWYDSTEHANDVGDSLATTRYARSIGLTGSVWRTGRSRWIENIFDETEIRRAPFLHGLNVRATILIPIKFSDQVLGVFEFFADAILPLDEELLALLDELGEIVGRYVKAKQLEQERAQLHALIERKSAEWTMTFDAIESPVLVMELDGTISRLNHAASELAGASYRELIGRSLNSVADDGPWLLILEALKAVRDSGESYSTQLEDAGGNVWDIAASLYHSPGPEATRVIVICRDITRLVELQNSLRRGEQLAAMGELVAGVAHEVRNPPFGISATLDTLDLIRANGGDAADLYAALRSWVDRLNQLMRQLLEYGKSWSINLVPGEVTGVVNGAIDLSRQLADARGVTIISNLRSTPAILMDSARLVQVFENLIRNGIEYAPLGKGRVDIVVDLANVAGRQFVSVVVSDNGPGFRPEDLHRVFQPFFTRRRAGTGLGLSIVQRIVDEHGGSVTAGNAAEGGAVLRVLLPVTPAAERRDTH